MFELRDKLCFAGQRKIEDFQSNATIELAVARRIDNAHPAAADLGFQFVARSGQVRKRSHMP